LLWEVIIMITKIKTRNIKKSNGLIINCTPTDSECSPDDNYDGCGPEYCSPDWYGDSCNPDSESHEY